MHDGVRVIGISRKNDCCSVTPSPLIFFNFTHNSLFQLVNISQSVFFYPRNISSLQSCISHPGAESLQLHLHDLSLGILQHNSVSGSQQSPRSNMSRILIGTPQYITATLIKTGSQSSPISYKLLLQRSCSCFLLSLGSPQTIDLILLCAPAIFMM